MTAWSILGLVPKPAGRIVGGRILYQGEDLLRKSDSEMQQIRGSGICMVMQDPLTSLNPVFNIGNQILECLRMNREPAATSLRDQAISLLSNVRIPDPETRLAAFPHQMSGGMRQRVVGAIAISRSPNLLIADEPTTSLDATIQLQYLTLLKEIQAETGAAIIFHYPRLRHCSEDVRPRGRHVRRQDRGAGQCAPTIRQPGSHPYTEALLPFRPRPGRPNVDVLAVDRRDSRRALDNLPVGCSFAPRCPHVFVKCEEYPPEFSRSRRGHHRPVLDATMAATNVHDNNRWHTGMLLIRLNDVKKHYPVTIRTHACSAP